MRDATPLVNRLIQIKGKEYKIDNFYWSQNKELYVSVTVDGKTFTNFSFNSIVEYL